MKINISEILSNPSVIKNFKVEPDFEKLKLRRGSYPVSLFSKTDLFKCRDCFFAPHLFGNTGNGKRQLYVCKDADFYFLI